MSTESNTRRKVSRQTRNSKQRARGVDHRAKALALRKDGHSYPEIAKRLKLALSTVYEHVTKALAEVSEVAHEDAVQVRQLELDRLDALLVALAPRIKKHDVKAIEAAVKVAMARARLHGLDKQQVEVSGTGGLTIFLPAEEPAPAGPALPSTTTPGGTP